MDCSWSAAQAGDPEGAPKVLRTFGARERHLGGRKRTWERGRNDAAQWWCRGNGRRLRLAERSVAAWSTGSEACCSGRRGLGVDSLPRSVLGVMALQALGVDHAGRSDAYKGGDSRPRTLDWGRAVRPGARAYARAFAPMPGHCPGIVCARARAGALPGHRGADAGAFIECTGKSVRTGNRATGAALLRGVHPGRGVNPPGPPSRGESTALASFAEEAK